MIYTVRQNSGLSGDRYPQTGNVQANFLSRD